MIKGRFGTVVVFLLALSVMLLAGSQEAHSVIYWNESPLTFRWSAATGTVNNYEVYISKNGAAYPATASASVTGTSYTFSAQDETSYALKVRAVSQTDGPGPFSDPSQVVMVFLHGTASDTDGDGVPNTAETTSGCSSPYDTDSDDDGIPDGVEDANHNGRVDAGETDPCEAGAVNDLICDNGSSCSSYTGSWWVSGGEEPYGQSSLYGKSGSTYSWRFQIPQSGNYQLSMWWTEFYSRPTAAPVTLRCGSTVVDTFSVNQQEDGGQWNWLSSFQASQGQTCTVTIQAAPSGSTCADAVKLSSAFGGTACGNGSVDAAEECDGNDDDACPNLCQADCTCSDAARTICDNGDSCTSFTKVWQVSGGVRPYGDEALYGKWGATYTWDFRAPRAGNLNVYMWWTEYASRCTDCPVTLECGGRVLDNFTLNQQENGGKWNWLGGYPVQQGQSCSVTIEAEGGESTCADAVMFEVE
ncbi:MAG: hypothetical protein AB1640_15595 [bacterium]